MSFGRSSTCGRKTRSSENSVTAPLPGTSDLTERLRARGFDTVLITGAVTHVCCESSARDANMMNFRAVMVSDGNAANTREEHDASLTAFYNVFGDVMDTDMVIAGLGETCPQELPREEVMRENRVKRILKEGGLALGTHAGSPTRRSSRSSGSPGSMPPSSIWNTPATTCTMCSLP